MKDLKYIGIGILIAISVLFINYTFKEDGKYIKIFLSNIIQKEEKTLTIGRPNDSIALDPSVVTDLESFRVTINIYDNLVSCDQNGDNIKPSLAKAWSVSEDGLIWKFTIRDNVYFHDGTVLDANAVVFNFNRWMDIHSPYHTGQFVYWNMNFEGFPGIIENVKALSDDTVEIVLNKPYSPFLSTLAIPSFAIASPEAIMKYNEDLKYKPVGSGPFIFDSWDENGDITLKTNYKYWGEQAKVHKLIFKTISDSKERIEKMNSGEILIADNLTIEEISKIKDNKNISLIKRSFFNIGYLSFNMNNPDLKIRFVRRAISYLIDKNEMLNVAFDSSAKVASTFVPPVLWGYNETIKAISYDVDYAKFLLNNFNKNYGFTVKLLVMEEPRTYFPKPIELANFIKESLKVANINVIVEAKPWEEVLRLGQNGDYDMILAGWNGDVADPDNFLYTFFSAENMKEGIISNYSFYNNSQVNSLLTLARQTTDKAFRNSLYREIQKIISIDTPSIPLVHTIPTIGINKRVKGYITNISGIEKLNHVNIVKE